VRDDVPADSPWYEKIDWKEYRRVVRLSTHFLDNVIDANQYPLPEITELAQRIRRIGLGVMGFADLLVRIGVPYNSDEGVEVGRRIMEFLDEESKKASEELAETRGTFPEWERSIWGPDESCARAPNGDRIRPERKLRNCNVTTVAPTGTISIFAGCSSGIEPLFAVAFMRNQAGSLMPDVNEDFLRVAGGGVALRGPDGADRPRGAHPLRRGAGAGAARLRDGARHHAGVARADAGRLPGALRFGDLQDHQLPQPGVGGGRPADLRPGVPPGVQGGDGLPRRLARQPGALHGRDQDAGAAGGGAAKVGEAQERIAKLEREMARLRGELSQAEQTAAAARKLKRRGRRCSAGPRGR
jgi:ribonucleoside-diphosphate reductase alpha chain